MTNCRYFVLDAAAKKLVTDDKGVPRKFEKLEGACTLRAEIMPAQLFGDNPPLKWDGIGAYSFAVTDDLGNKWIWSEKGDMRFAMSHKTKEVVGDKVRNLYDSTKESFVYNIRATTAGIVQTEHQARLPDGPPIPVVHNGRTFSDLLTTDRWANKTHWVNRGDLAPMIADVKTQEHPQELRARREAEKARKRREREEYLAGKQMTCQACGRAICSKRGVVALHGYERPGDGYQTDSCMGAKEVPLEVSNVILLKVIGHWEREVEYLLQKIDAVKAEAEPVRYVHKPYSHWSAPKAAPIIYKLTRATFEADRAASKGNIEYDDFDYYKERHIATLESWLRGCSNDLAGCRDRNKDWKQTMKFVAGEWEPIAARPSDAEAA